MKKTFLAVFASTFIVCSLAFFPVNVRCAVSFQTSQDTSLNAQNPHHNYNWGWLFVQGSDNPFRALVQFDLCSIPPGSTVSWAQLALYYCDWAMGDPVGRTLWAYRVTQSWTEGGATWNTYDGTNPWATPGGDYTTTGGASATVPSLDGGRWMLWTVTDIVKAWVEGGEPNYGFLVKDGSESGETRCKAKFVSTEHEAWPLGVCPYLLVTYTAAPAVDSDGDGLFDAEEQCGCYITLRDCLGGKTGSYHVTSDPFLVDTDEQPPLSDGLDDYEEKQGWLVSYRVYNPDPPPETLLIEYVVRSNPNEMDADGDGLEDWRERFVGTDPNKVDTDCDMAYATNDGFEVDHGLDPCDFDTDDDGVSDGEEIDLWLETGYSLTEAVAKTNDPQAVPTPPAVGGKATPINMPINKPELQTPWIWLSTITLSLVLAVVYVKKRKRHIS